MPDELKRHSEEVEEGASASKRTTYENENELNNNSAENSNTNNNSITTSNGNGEVTNASASTGAGVGFGTDGGAVSDAGNAAESESEYESESEFEELPDEEKIPVTILTGFLGSGKTTFVNYLLKANHGKKLAIVENEFGEVGIDDGLVVNAKENTIEMMNGCICCTVRDDLIGALKELYRNRKGKFNAVVIETTGLADPAPVAQTFFVDEDMKKLFKLDAIVTFIDSKHTPGHLDEKKPEGVENEAVEQVAFADVLVLNKTDLVTPTQLTDLKKKLRSINRGAKMLESQFSRVPVEQVLDIKSFNLEKCLEVDDAFLDVDHSHMHDNKVSSVGVCIEGEFDPGRFEEWLNGLLREKGADIYRSKGILAMKGTNERFVFQGVHMMLDMDGSQGDSSRSANLPDWGPGEKRMNKLCFIGKNLNREEIVAGLEECIDDAKYPDPGPRPNLPLRFKFGDEVLVNLGVWLKGVIVCEWFREPLWPTGRYVPYQIEIIEGPRGFQGLLVAVPRDTEQFIRDVNAMIKPPCSGHGHGHAHGHGHGHQQHGQHQQHDQHQHQQHDQHQHQQHDQHQHQQQQQQYPQQQQY